jgi:uncharacterized membrane protein
MRGERVPFPWVRLLTVALLGAALAFAISAGHTGDAIVIALVMVPGALFLGAALLVRYKAGRERNA